MVYTYLPFMILPLYANRERLDPTLYEAAMDLGSRPFAVFLDVPLPHPSPATSRAVCWCSFRPRANW